MKKRFLNCFSIVLNDICNNTINISYDAFKFVKSYIFDHPNDEDVLMITNLLIDKYQEILLDNNFINTLNLNDDLRYLKRQEIQKNLPFLHTNIYYPNYFFKIFTIPSQYYGPLANFYKGLFVFLKEKNKCLLNNNQIEIITNFLDNNKLILNHQTNKYDILSLEIERYKMALQNKLTYDYFDFKKDKEAFSLAYNHRYEGNIIEDYKNKKLGIIGELFTFNYIQHIQQSINAHFISKDFGDGFGYDIYFQRILNNITYENLIEVKTTTNINGDDYFSLSENEYNTMLQSQNYGNVNYYICRVFVDISNNYFNLDFLKFENNYFKSLNTSLEYMYTDNQNNCYYFVNKQKNKVFTKL